MAYNRIAVYGHRGWVSSAVFAALVQSGAPIKVLYRPGSDVSDLPEGVVSVEVDVEDQQAVESALQDVDIVMYALLPSHFLLLGLVIARSDR